MLELFEKMFGTDVLKMVGDVIPKLITILIVLIAIKIIMKFVQKGVEKSKLEKGLHTFTIKVIKIILCFIAVLIVADMFGIPISSLLATFSIVGLAFSLAIQDTLSNLASGITIIVTHPFRVGNFVEAGGSSRNRQRN